MPLDVLLLQVINLDFKGLRKPPSSLNGIPLRTQVLRFWGSGSTTTRATGKGSFRNSKLTRLDLSPLSACSQLRELDVSHSKKRIADLRPLSACQALEILNVSHTSVSDLTPLSACGSLSKLSCSHTSIWDLTPLAACKALKFLECSECSKVADLSPLAACVSLEVLFCDGTRVRDLTPLAGLLRLSEVKCDPEVDGLKSRHVRLNHSDSDDDIARILIYSHPSLPCTEITVEEEPDWD